MKTTLLHTFWSVILLSLLAACADPGRFADYRKNNPLVVSKATVSLTIDAPLNGRPMSIEDSSNLRGFINDYINRGRTAVTVEMNTGADGPANSSKTQRTLDLLIRAGLHFNEISFRNTGVNALGNDILTLSFTASSVKVPECSDWSNNTDYNWSNLNSGNYGCSYRRNLGLNLANPGDLKKARQQSGRSGLRSDAIISGYRAGTFGTTGATTSGTTGTTTP